MTHTQIEARMQTLREQLKTVDEELGQLRPRVHYLESMLLRLDGALCALQSLGELETPAPPHGPQATAQPVAS